MNTTAASQPTGLERKSYIKQINAMSELEREKKLSGKAGSHADDVQGNSCEWMYCGKGTSKGA